MGRGVVGGDRRLLAVAELERIDQYFWTQALETSGKDQTPAISAVQVVLPLPILTIELAPRLTAPSKEAPRPQTPKTRHPKST